MFECSVVSHIGGDDQYAHLRMQRADFRGDRLQRVGAAGRKHEVCPALRESQGERAPDPARGPGNQDYLPGKVASRAGEPAHEPRAETQPCEQR